MEQGATAVGRTMVVAKRLFQSLLIVSALLSAGLPLQASAANKTQLSIYQWQKPVGYMPCGSSVLQKRSAVLMGGGTDVSEAFTKMITFMNSCAAGSPRPGNFVVVRAGGNPAYDSYIAKQGPVAAVITIVIPDRDSALALGDPSNEVGQQAKALLQTAGAVFITGGDQESYYNFWKGTPVESLIATQVAKYAVPIGGTSAGMMMLSEIAYVPDNSYSSGYALSNPYFMHQWLHNDFWSNHTPFPPLRYTVTDSHFNTRDRMGRLVTFLADSISSNWKPFASYSNARAIGVDDQTALVLSYPSSSSGSNVSVTTEVLVNPKVVGAAYILTPIRGSLYIPLSGPLTFDSVQVQRWTPTGLDSSYTLDVNAGVISPPDPY